jgi:hypothetical protein
MRSPSSPTASARSSPSTRRTTTAGTGGQKPRYVPASVGGAVDVGGDMQPNLSDGVWYSFLDAQDLIGYPLETLFTGKLQVKDIRVETGTVPIQPTRATRRTPWWPKRSPSASSWTSPESTCRSLPPRHLAESCRRRVRTIRPGLRPGRDGPLSLHANGLQFLKAPGASRDHKKAPARIATDPSAANTIRTPAVEHR